MKNLKLTLAIALLVSAIALLTGCGSSLEMEDCCNDSNASSVADTTITETNATTTDTNASDANVTTTPEPVCTPSVEIDNFGSYLDGDTLRTELGVVEDDNISLHLDVENLTECNITDLHAIGNIVNSDNEVVQTFNRHLVNELVGEGYHVENWELNISDLAPGTYTISVEIVSNGDGEVISETACVTFVIEEDCESTCDEIEVIIDDFEGGEIKNDQLDLYLAIENTSDCDAHYVHAVGRIVDANDEVVQTFNQHLINDLYGGDYYSEDLQIDVSNLASGTYTLFVEIRDDEGEGDIISVAEACVTFVIEGDDC